MDAENPLTDMDELLSHAAEKRKALPGQPTAYRLLNGMGDSLEGVTLDRYGTHYQIQFFGVQNLSRESELIQAVLHGCDPSFLVVKYRLDPSGRALETPAMKVVHGAADQSVTEVEEYGCRFRVDLLDTVNPGLFLDMRDIRDAVGQMSIGREILNLFSYTCSFGVHSRMNGATRAVNVDVSGKILEKGRQNYALNGLECLPGEFFKGDSAEYLDWAIRKKKRFGGIVLDPPSFARHRHGVFSVREHMAQLVGSCAQVLEPQGFLMLSTNYSAWTCDELAQTALEAFRSHGIGASLQWKKGQGLDFPGSGKMKESSLSAVLLQKDIT